MGAVSFMSDESAQAARLRDVWLEAIRAGVLAPPLAALHHPQLSPTCLQALWWLWRERTLSVRGLAQRLDAPVPRVSKMLDQLERAGFGVRSRAHEDRRQVRVRLTADGRAVAEAVDRHALERLSLLLRPLGEEDREQLLRILQRWAEAVGGGPRAEP